MSATIQFDQKTEKYSFTANGKTYASKNLKYCQYQFKLHGSSSETTAVAENEVEEEKFSINQRFEFISNFVSMVSSGLQASVIITGPGGTGKSTIVNKTLKAEGFTDITNTESFLEGEKLPTKHFKIVKGFSTAKSLYRLLYENRSSTSILVFDDCDNILNEPVAANLLKSALDSNSERILSWNSEKSFSNMEDDLPRSFRFNGGVIFVSNLDKSKIPQALRTRSLIADVSMTLDQKIERMEYLLTEEDFMPEAQISIKNLAMKILKENKDKAKEVSLRSLQQVIRIGMKFTGEKFEQLAKYALTN